MKCVIVHEDSNNPVYFVCCETDSDVEILRAKLAANEDFGYGHIDSVHDCNLDECYKNEDHHEVDCNYCDDKGCVMCQTSRFIIL